MKNDKDIQLNRGRCVYRSIQHPIVTDTEEDNIDYYTPEKKEDEKDTIAPDTGIHEVTENGKTVS